MEVPVIVRAVVAGTKIPFPPPCADVVIAITEPEILPELVNVRLNAEIDIFPVPVIVGRVIASVTFVNESDPLFTMDDVELIKPDPETSRFPDIIDVAPVYVLAAIR